MVPFYIVIQNKFLTNNCTNGPKTSDPTEMAGWMMTLIVSAGATFVTARKKKED